MDGVTIRIRVQTKWLQRKDFRRNSLVDNPQLNSIRSSFDGTARLWDSVTGECHFVFRDHRRPLYSLEFSPDGRFLATGSGDGWLHLYHTKVCFIPLYFFFGSHDSSFSHTRDSSPGLRALRNPECLKLTGRCMTESTGLYWLWSAGRLL